MHLPHDVPSPIDLRLPHDAADWERTANIKRPWRYEFFQCFSDQIGHGPQTARVLELGSGPGYLATHLLAEHSRLRMVLLDFSSAMHSLARNRLAPFLDRVSFVERDFREPGWFKSIGMFDFVVTHQAVHEVRHKRHVPTLHAQVRAVLAPQGQYLVCDHCVGEDGMRNGDLYMTAEEQRQALVAAGYQTVLELKRKGGLVLHSAV